MRPATRMMMISSLGERQENQGNAQNQGYQNNERQMRPDPRMQGGYQSGYDMEQGGMQNEMRGGYEGRRMEGATGRRRGNGQYAQARQGGMYSGRDDPMGFDMSGHSPEEEEGEDEWSGRFRGVSVDAQSKEGGEKEPEEEKLKKWVKGMKNADGTTGEHFKEDHTNLMRANHCPGCDKAEFYAAVNMMYSDYCEVAKRMGVDNPDFYACMAKAFLMDKDAGKGKIAKYMQHVAGK